MEHIYSNYYEIEEKITELKKDILGVVLHDDAENYSAKNYITWLNKRIEKKRIRKRMGERLHRPKHMLLVSSNTIY